jgi:hypothetical protein
MMETRLESLVGDLNKLADGWKTDEQRYRSVFPSA